MSERHASLTSSALAAGAALTRGRNPSLTVAVPTGAPVASSGPIRKPLLASVGTTACATTASTGASSRHEVSAPSSPHSTTASPRSRQAVPLAAAASPPSKQRNPSYSHRQQQQQPLVPSKPARGSFSSASSRALDQHRIEIFFHVPTYQELQRLRVHRTLTLVGLHATVQREFAIPFEDQRIYWHGDLLEGDEDLAFYDIHDQSVLNIRVRKRYRSIGDVLTKVKTVQFGSTAKPDDYEVVEVVAPLPPTHILFKRLVVAIAYLQRLDVMQSRRTERRVWKQRVVYWEEHAPLASSGRRRTSLASPPTAPQPASPSHPHHHHRRSRERAEVAADKPSSEAVPPAFVMLNAGPERVSHVVSLAQTHAIAQRLQLPADKRAASDLRHIKKWLASLKFFASASLPDAALHEVARACLFARVDAGAFIFRQGDVGDHLYILISGCVSLAAYGNGYFATLTPGQCFGEISLFEGNNGLRTASANVNFAAPHAELALLSGDIYRRVINPYKQAVLQSTEKALYSVPQLRSLPYHIATHVAYASKALHAKHGRLLVRHGEDVNVLVILVQGEVKVSVTARSTSSTAQQAAPRAFPIVSVVRAPAVFCQEAVLTNTPSPAPWDIEALDCCQLLCLRVDTISIFLSPRHEIVRALNREHAQRLQDFDQRFGHHALPPGPIAAAPSHSNVSRRSTPHKLPTKASYMRMLASRLFDSQRSLDEHKGRRQGRRGAADHVEFPTNLLRGAAESSVSTKESDVRGTNRIRSRQNETPTTQLRKTTCADVQDEFLHRALPFGNILSLRDQIQFCSFAARELDEPDDRGRTHALLTGLRQLPVEEVELAPSGGDIHFRFVPRAPTSLTVSSSTLIASQPARRHLETR